MDIHSSDEESTRKTCAKGTSVSTTNCKYEVG